MTDQEKKKYYDVLVDEWRMFGKNRGPELFSDDWWKEIVDEYLGYAKKYEGTPLEDYSGELAMVFLNAYERVYKDSKSSKEQKLSLEDWGEL